LNPNIYNGLAVMSKTFSSTFLAVVFALPLLFGCNKKNETALVNATETGPAAPEAPAAPEPATATVEGAQVQAQAQPPTGAPANSTSAPAAPAAGASIGPNGVEASAGDVSVKLPN
jgi:hypothetical protein